MQYQEHAASPALRDRIECFWILRAPAGARPHRVLPDGCVDILFDADRAPIVVGAMTRALVTGGGTTPVDLLGVRFRPGEAAAVLGVPLRSLADRSVDLSEIWGRPAAFEAAVDAPSDAAKRLCIERALSARIASHAEKHDVAARRVRAAVRWMQTRETPTSVSDVASRLGVTTRTLERLFEARVGLQPKTLSRILRLQRLVAAIDRSRPSWSNIAADLGFADQAHLVRDVRDLADVSPSVLLQERHASSDFINTGPSVGATVPPAIANTERSGGRK